MDESDVEDEWEIVATDDDLNTFVEYSSAGPCGFGSRLTLRWRPPETVPSGTYRVGVRGVAKGIRKFVKNESPGAYEGTRSGSLWCARQSERVLSIDLKSID